MKWRLERGVDVKVEGGDRERGPDTAKHVGGEEGERELERRRWKAQAATAAERVTAEREGKTEAEPELVQHQAQP